MQKKALLALAFASLLTLAGCGGPDSTGTDTSTPEPGVQPVDPDADPWGLGYTARDVYDAIADISSNLCYAFEFEIDGDTYQEIHTSEYSYSNLTDAILPNPFITSMPSTLPGTSSPGAPSTTSTTQRGNTSASRRPRTRIVFPSFARPFLRSPSPTSRATKKATSPIRPT